MPRPGPSSTSGPTCPPPEPRRCAGTASGPIADSSIDTCTTSTRSCTTAASTCRRSRSCAAAGIPRSTPSGRASRNMHRALDDIRESIEELRFYREQMFIAARGNETAGFGPRFGRAVVMSATAGSDDDDAVACRSPSRGRARCRRPGAATPGRAAASGNTATPIAAVRPQSGGSNALQCRAMCSRMSSARRRASRTSGTGATTTNSSPPRRTSSSYPRVRSRKRLRARDDHRVAGLVAELVVHGLEAVEVEQQQGHALAVALGPAEVLVERTLEPAPVAEAGQRLRLGLFAQARASSRCGRASDARYSMTPCTASSSGADSSAERILAVSRPDGAEIERDAVDGMGMSVVIPESRAQAAAAGPTAT